VKLVEASIASLETPFKHESPSSARTPQSAKKPKTPEKQPVKKAVNSADEPIAKLISSSETSVSAREDMPVHYRRFIDDLRLLDETLSLFRVKNQVSYMSRVRENLERASGRRFTIDHFKQLMTATGGDMFKGEWMPLKDIDGKIIRYELVLKAVDSGQEVYNRLSSDQARNRTERVIKYLNEKLKEFLDQNEANKPENAYPIKPFSLTEKPDLEPIGCATPGRTRLLTKCDSVASDGSVLKTPKSSLRRHLSVSASPILPNALPQFISTPVKLPSVSSPVAPMSAKEKLDAIRNRVKAREVVDVQEAKAYDEAMVRKEKKDEFELCIKLLIKLNRNFPRGIETAKLSTLKNDYGSMFSDSNDLEKYTMKICELVPGRFELANLNEQKVLRLKTKDVKFSVIKKEIEIQRNRFCEIRE